MIATCPACSTSYRHATPDLAEAAWGRCGKCDERFRLGAGRVYRVAAPRAASPRVAAPPIVAAPAVRARPAPPTPPAHPPAARKATAPTPPARLPAAERVPPPVKFTIEPLESVERRAAPRVAPPPAPTEDTFDLAFDAAELPDLDACMDEVVAAPAPPVAAAAPVVAAVPEPPGAPVGASSAAARPTLVAAVPPPEIAAPSPSPPSLRPDPRAPRASAGFGALVLPALLGTCGASSGLAAAVLTAPDRALPWATAGAALGALLGWIASRLAQRPKAPAAKR